MPCLSEERVNKMVFTGKKKVWRQPVFPEEGCGKTRSEINARYSTPVQL